MATIVSKSKPPLDLRRFNHPLHQRLNLVQAAFNRVKRIRRIHARRNYDSVTLAGPMFPERTLSLPEFVVWALRARVDA